MAMSTRTEPGFMRATRSSLTNVTLPYAVELANRGWRDALRADASLAKGLNTHDGQITYASVAEAHGLPGLTLEEALA
jgi:alanine dehydrogenase